jgi:beta-1,4-N-acetylglucosaminyltransferase
MASGYVISENAKWHRIHRSREVKQSWITTIFSTIHSLYDSFILISYLQPSLILCNGPGTCVPICYIAWLCHRLRVFYSASSKLKIVFVESFCRVEKLSFTGQLLKPIADKFIVQWPNLVHKYPGSEYIGIIC